MMDLQWEMTVGGSLRPPTLFAALSLQTGPKKPSFEHKALVVNAPLQNFLEGTTRIGCNLLPFVPSPALEMRRIDLQVLQMPRYRPIVPADWNQTKLAKCLSDAP